MWETRSGVRTVIFDKTKRVHGVELGSSDATAAAAELLIVKTATCATNDNEENKPDDSKETASGEGENPFGKKEDFFGSENNHDDDLFNSKDGKDNILEHLGDFEFVDENNRTDVDHFDSNFQSHE